MFKCNCCGKTFEEPYNYSVEEGRGEYWGVPCTETVYFSECPECGSDDFEKGTLYHVEGKVYASVDAEIVDERGRTHTIAGGETMQVAEFDGEYFAEDDGEALYDEVLADQQSEWCWKFGDDIDVDIEVYWEA